MYLPRQIFEVKSEYFFHAASDILFCVFAASGQSTDNIKPREPKLAAICY